MSAVLNTVTASLQRLEGQAGHTGTSFGKIAGGMAVGTVAANAFMGAVNAVTGTLAGMGKGALDLASRLEQAKIGFTTMLGGAQQADAFIRKLQAFAESTSFSFPGIQQVAQSFLAMGFEAKNVIPVITDVSNALAAAGKGGDTEALQRVGMSLSEIAAQGKVTAEQLRELARNGIAVMPMLASAFNKTTAEIRKMAEEGEISATMFFEAFHSETARRYGDIQAEQAKTWAVAISNVGDIIGRMTTETLAEFFGALTRGALLLQDFLKSERVAAWAADMKSAIHEVIAALAPLGAALQDALGLGGSGATAPKLGPILGPSPAEVAKALTVPPEAIKSAKDYDAQIKAATASIHDITAELTGLTAQQDALKIKIQDTTKQYELQLIGLRDQLEANNAAIDETKAKWEGVIAPLERTQDQLKRLADDTKADFAKIMDPLKAQLDEVKRKIQDTKTAFEATARPLQDEITRIEKVNSALTKQLNLANEIADLATRQKALSALGDPNLRADLPGKLKLNELNRNELEWQKDLIELKTKKGDVEKATRGVDKELDANTRERIKLEQQLQGAANKGLLAQVASEEELNKAKRDQTAIDLANAKIAADAEKAPFEDQLEQLKAQLATTLDPLEVLADSLSRAIEDTATAEAAALAPIIAAQDSVARQIEDANQAMKDALAPLEAASKAIAAQITEVEAAQRTALEPLKEQQTALERQRDVLEVRKKQIADNIAGWKDEATAIKAAGEEAAKVAKALDLSGGEESSAAPGDRTGTSPLAQFPRPEPATVAAFKELAQNVQASADAFNNLNVATSGGLVGNLVELGRILGTFVIAGVIVGWLTKLAGSLRAIRSPAGLAQLGLTGVLLILERFPEIAGWIKTADDSLKGFFAELHNLTDQVGAWWTERHQSDQENAERTKAFWAAKDAERTDSWNAFWTGLLSAPADFWASLGPQTAEEQAKDKAAWDAWHAERTEAWTTFWAGLPGVVTTELAKIGPALAAQLAAWKTDWEAWETTRTAAWNQFWTDLKTNAEAAWKVFTDWLKPATDAVIGWIDPIAMAFKGISDAIRNLPATLPDWWSQRPGWLGGTGGLQRTGLRLPQAGDIQGDALSLSGGGLQGDTLLRHVFDQFGAALGEEGARAAASVARTEGGLHGAVGDSGTSFGVFQFHEGGQLNAFAAWLNSSLEEAANIATTRPDIAVKFALENYLGKTIAAGLEAGLSGPELATYAQRYGQVSVSPERAGQSYESLFGAGGSMPETTVDLSGGVSMQNYVTSVKDLTGAQVQLANSTTVVAQAQSAAASASAAAAAGLTQILAPTQALNSAQAAAVTQAQTFAQQQAALAQVLSGQVNPALISTKDAMANFSAVLSPIERQVAGGQISMGELQAKLTDLARATGIAVQPFADLSNGLITQEEAMRRVVNAAADVNPQFDALRQTVNAGATSLDQATLDFLQMALNLAKIAPATAAATTATAGLTTATGAVNKVVDPELFQQAATASDTLAEALAGTDRAYMNVQESASSAGDTMKDFLDAAQSLGDYLDGHTFEFKVNLPDLPDWAIPGSPTPFEMGLRGIGHAMDDLGRKRVPVLAGGDMPLGAPLGGGGGGQTTINIAPGAIVVNGGDPQMTARAVRDEFIRITRNNAGRVL